MCEKFVIKDFHLGWAVLAISTAVKHKIAK